MSRCWLALLFVHAAFAQQGTGELRLAVKDASGAPMPARAGLVSQATHTEQTVDTSADGRYSFKNLPFGFYRLLVSKPGFASSSELIEVRSEIPQSHTVTLKSLAVVRQKERRYEDAERLNRRASLLTGSYR